MYPESWYEPVNHKLHTYLTQFYDHFENMLKLRAINTDEPGWDMIQNPIQMLDENDWDNDLPTLIYHSHGAHCSSQRVHHLRLMIEAFGEAHGKNLFAACIPVEDLYAHIDKTPNTNPIFNEAFTSIYTSTTFQAKQYCDAIKKHPVFGKSDFNIIGIS